MTSAFGTAQEMILREPSEVDGGSESSSSEEQPITSATKRSSSQSDLDSLPSGNKKRRKQTTPVKFSTSTPPAGGVPTNNGAVLPSDENLNNEFRCQYCAQLFEERDALELHLECEHGFAYSASAGSLSSSASLSRSSPPVISVKNFANPNSWMTKATPVIPAGLAQFLPGLAGFPMADANQRGGPRIFNPDAYCELCNKEFCNKYFLKTHKANKHGIYMDPMAPGLALDNLPQPQQFKSVISNHHHPQEDMEGTPGGMESLFKQELDLDNQDPPHRVGVMNPEAFCEICCKEYCNKYFLRTHKLKKHGIFLPVDQQQQQQQLLQQQTSPLNLIMPGSNGADTGEDYECRSCGIRFQTMGLYHLHLEKIHNDDGALGGGEDQDQNNISEDLQKLQTMILQLKGLESNKAASCALCGRDCDNPDQLRQHMAQEHGVAAENLLGPATTPIPMTATIKQEPQQPEERKPPSEDYQPSTPGSKSSGGGGIKPQSTPTTNNSSGVFMTPTSSYCEICNKELCNKYFMKTHMQKMHGIEIENGSQIGGVVCNICNKELCSKYFLRVHKQNTHGIVEDGGLAVGGSPGPGSGPTGEEDSALIKPSVAGDLNADMSQRYFTHFTEVCPICNRRFRTVKWLKTHLTTEHGKAGVDKWREMEISGQTTTQSKTGQSKSNNSPTLKIPNGNSSLDQLPIDLASMSNQVLSNLLGDQPDSASQQQQPSLRCSQCGLVTNNLPFFFYHERMHHQQQQQQLDHLNLGQDDGSVQCPMCSQSLGSILQLRQHILTRHPLPGLMSPGQMPLPFSGQEEDNIKKEPTSEATMNHHHRRDSGSPKSELEGDQQAVQVMSQGCYKCAQCGFATANLNRIKKHMRKDHKSLQTDPQEQALQELCRTLKDVANKHKVPASYAIPQDFNCQGPNKPIMQPFLIEERETPTSNHQNNRDQDREEGKRFAPALVYLPVKSRVSGSFNVTFNLNPA